MQLFFKRLFSKKNKRKDCFIRKCLSIVGGFYNYRYGFNNYCTDLDDYIIEKIRFNTPFDFLTTVNLANSNSYVKFPSGNYKIQKNLVLSIPMKIGSCGGTVNINHY